MEILEITEEKKGKILVHTDGVGTFPFYKKEAQIYHLEAGGELTQEQWELICEEVLRKRVIKRAMFILQKMDRTESQLRQKLKENHYPEELIEVALDYVKSFHYIDDFRYASTYIRYHQEQKSQMQMRMTLMQRGVDSQIIDAAMEEEYEDQEDSLIQKLLEKKHYNPEEMDQKEKYRIYQYLLRRGFSGAKIKKHMEW